MSRPVASIAIVGRDAALWTMALGLSRALSGLGIRIEAVELPSLLRSADVYASTPHQALLHAMLRLEEGDVLAACAGSEALAQRFAGWSKGASSFMHAYDTVGAQIGEVDFVNYWTRARAEGLRAGIDDFSIGAAAAKVGRHVVYTEAVESFSQAAPGYNLDARRYVGVLRNAAVKAGVIATTTTVRTVELYQAGIGAVILADDSRVQADLYIDASGSEATLIGRLPGDTFESWSQWLPCNRLMAATGPRLRPLPAFNQITAFTGGWVGQYPLQNRTAVLAAYRGDMLSDTQALTTLSQITGMRLEAAVATPYAPGARPRPWLANCIAIGEAAVTLEPLDATALQLIHIGLSHVVSLFPVDADDQRERDAYNAELSQHVTNIRDFSLVHYVLNRRFDDGMWDRARNAPPPEVLAQKIELFGARGGLAMRDGETFAEGSWTSCFTGHGLIPRSWSPLVDKLTLGEQVEHFQRILGFIAAEVQDMPSLEAHLEFNAAPPGGGLF